MQESVDIRSIEQKALQILEEYKGSNNYILKLKQQHAVNPKFIPTRSQCDYIIGFNQVEPKVAKKCHRGKSTGTKCNRIIVETFTGKHGNPKTTDNAIKRTYNNK